jgi:ABC-2 type transport system ATP-binding protein
MIEVRNLYKTFGLTVALDGVDFDVHQGEVLGFLGPNGAGKTTTMRIITGFLRPDAGTVRVAGYDVAESPIEVKRRVGYLPEDNPLYNDMTVTEYLKFVGEVRGLKNGKMKDAFDRVVEICGLKEVIKRPIGELSKGFRQRVGLAQVLLHDPEILILDEPTSGLDPTQIVEIRSLIKELGKEKTILLSTHILPEVSVTSTRVVIINKGKIVASGTIEELTEKGRGGEATYIELKAPKDEVENIFSQTPWISSFTLVEEENGKIRYALKGKEGEDIREALFQLVKERDWTLLELYREKATLEEVFLELTTEEEL